MYCSVSSGSLGVLWVTLLVLNHVTSEDAPPLDIGQEPRNSNKGTIIDNAFDEDKGAMVKRAWNNLQGGWGKRGWQNLQSGWGKRVPILPVYLQEREAYQLADKRGWQNLQGGWGKRIPGDYWDNDENDASSQFEYEPGYIRSGNALAENDYIDDEKRTWSALNGAWGKRNNGWSKFRGSWGKREPAWNNLKGLWG